ncbi:GL11731 [Drosophila persimilis]|uniref:GL11731 n=1 Tax=Drosophila persimilis TaxID=7234 RepID=B4GDH9_DROPE|nr:GL11731 [Drosophila persimilis]
MFLQSTQQQNQQQALMNKSNDDLRRKRPETTRPNHILLFTIINPFYPITVVSTHSNTILLYGYIYSPHPPSTYIIYVYIYYSVFIYKSCCSCGLRVVGGKCWKQFWAVQKKKQEIK